MATLNLRLRFTVPFVIVLIIGVLALGWYILFFKHLTKGIWIYIYVGIVLSCTVLIYKLLVITIDSHIRRKFQTEKYNSLRNPSKIFRERHQSVREQQILHQATKESLFQGGNYVNSMVGRQVKNDESSGVCRTCSMVNYNNSHENIDARYTRNTTMRVPDAHVMEAGAFTSMAPAMSHYQYYDQMSPEEQRRLSRFYSFAIDEEEREAQTLNQVQADEEDEGDEDDDDF